MSNDLIERLEKATGPDRELDAEIMYLEIERGAGIEITRTPELTATANPYTASIDAALTLVPEGWAWRVDCWEAATAKVFIPEKRHHYSWHGKNPAIALCIAALRARSAFISGEHE